MPESPGRADALLQEVRLAIFRQAADTARVPQPPEIAAALGRPQAEVEQALSQLAAGKALILAPNNSNIWAANPFCAVPSGIEVDARGKTYWAICIWDALGIAAALDADAVIRCCCGDCGDPMTLAIEGGMLQRSEGIIHFAIRAHHWWDNIGFT